MAARSMMAPVTLSNAVSSQITFSIDTMSFTPSDKRQVHVVGVTNNGVRAVMFKLKSTNPSIFKMHPVYFQLQPGERKTMKFTFKGLSKRTAPRLKERFTVVMAYPPEQSSDLKKMWDKLKFDEKSVEVIDRKCIPIYYDGYEKQQKDLGAEVQLLSVKRKRPVNPDEKPSKSSKRLPRVPKTPPPMIKSPPVQTSARRGSKSVMGPPVVAKSPAPPPAPVPVQAPAPVPVTAPAPAPAPAPDQAPVPAPAAAPGEAQNLVYIIYQNNDQPDPQSEDGEETSEEGDENKKKKKK